MSADTNLSKTQTSKITQSGGFLDALFGKIAGPLMKVAVPLAKNMLVPRGVTVAASGIKAEIQKKKDVPKMTTPVISNEEMMT